jgi:hypothetical protein
VLCSELLEILLEERRRRVRKLWVRDWMRNRTITINDNNY